MKTEEVIVSFRGVRKTYDGETLVVKQLDLDIYHGEFLTLLGPSGCGQTTLLQAISGFVQLDGGRILIDGEDMTDRPPYRRPVNTVFQNYALFPHMTVGENTGYALEVAGDSMVELGILDGDYALIRRQETARDGEIVVALIDDAEATLKTLRHEGRMIRLDPANRQYDPQRYRPEQVQIQGRLAGLLRRY